VLRQWKQQSVNSLPCRDISRIPVKTGNKRESEAANFPLMENEFEDCDYDTDERSGSDEEDSNTDPDDKGQRRNKLAYVKDAMTLLIAFSLTSHTRTTATTMPTAMPLHPSTSHRTVSKSCNNTFTTLTEARN